MPDTGYQMRRKPVPGIWHPVSIIQTIKYFLLLQSGHAEKGEWSMGNGQWGMVNGEWSMVNTGPA